MSQADPIRLLQSLSIFHPEHDASGDALSKSGCANNCKDCACKGKAQGSGTISSQEEEQEGQDG